MKISHRELLKGDYVKLKFNERRIINAEYLLIEGIEFTEDRAIISCAGTLTLRRTYNQYAEIMGERDYDMSKSENELITEMKLKKAAGLVRRVTYLSQEEKAIMENRYAKDDRLNSAQRMRLAEYYANLIHYEKGGYIDYMGFIRPL